MFIAELFTKFIYQPFFNLLIFIYWLLGFGVKEPDMGVAVIILTIIIRLLLLPLNLAESRGEKSRRQIATEIAEVEKKYATDPVALTKATKAVLRRGRGVVVSEVITLIIQTSIALMLWRIFATGLSGADFHLTYSFMPKIATPLNLMFLDKFDLTHPHLLLNLIQSVLIFILEALKIYSSPYPHTRDDVVRLQLVLPVVSFLVFMALPAGKKLFVITTLCFSILLTLYKAARQYMVNLEERWQKRQEVAEAKARGEEPLVQAK